MRNQGVWLGLWLLLWSLAGTAHADVWQTAERNGQQANEALRRCQRVLEVWYGRAGNDNFLLPRSGKDRLWRANDNTADQWSHFVNAAYVLDDPALITAVRQTLLDHIRLATRVEHMIDDYDIDANRFTRPTAQMNLILFGAAEEVKDGLLPIIDLTGEKAYLERAVNLLVDIHDHALLQTRYGFLPDSGAEINGCMLQNLCRLYCATADPKLKRWAEQIGEAWIYQCLANNNGLPAHNWDFATNRPKDDRLLLVDHGNEIIFGLVELLAMEYVHDQAKYKQYLPHIKKMIDTLLARATNEQGLWRRTIRPSDFKILASSVPDTWGYCLNAVYTMYQLTKDKKYLDATTRAMRALATNPLYRDWGRLNDSWADSLEGGILLYNRVRLPEMAAWLEALAPRFLAQQKSDGTVMGNYLDGNYVRTALMWALLKTAGARLKGWREDVKFGATISGGRLYLQLRAASAWRGQLCLDGPRFRANMGLRIDYPRINQYPQWFTVLPDAVYDVRINGKSQGAVLGQELIDGLPLAVGSGGVRVMVSRRAGPPY